jgi:DNA-binding NarL/FixJ family response regulator
VADRLRILLVEDNIALRAGLAALLRMDPSMVLIGEAGDGETAVGLAAELKPDVILMDVVMPGALDGMAATREILAANPLGPVVIALSGSGEYRDAMLEAGAAAFVPKDGTVDIRGAIKEIAARRTT